MQYLIGARFHLERRLAGGKGARILGEPRERIEYLAASPAAHLAAGGAQHLGRQPGRRFRIWRIA